MDEIKVLNRKLFLKYVWLKYFKKVNCKKKEIGMYECYKKTKKGKCVDACLKDEIDYLNKHGIETIGCCCGHDKVEPYIQTREENIYSMKVRGYIKTPINEYGYGVNCYEPKTSFPYEEFKKFELPEPDSLYAGISNKKVHGNGFFVFWVLVASLIGSAIITFSVFCILYFILN